MRRTIKLRARAVEMTTLDGVVAMKQTRRARLARSALPLEVAAGPLVPQHEGVTTFLQAGWYFAAQQEGLLFAARAGTSVPGAEAVREVSVLPSGRMVVSGDTLAVRLSDAVEPANVASVLTNDRLNLVRSLPFDRTYQVRTTGPESALDAALRLNDLAHYDFAEPDLHEAIGHRWRPTDPDYPRQWQWNNQGGNGGALGADARLEGAWDVTRGLRANGSRVRIAVIDNGLDVRHPDLRSAIVHGGHFDNDGTGGTSFAPYHAASSFPDDNHGTLCAGMALARANNGTGGCGAAPEAAFIPIACFEDQVGTQVTLAMAIAYAALPSRQEPGRPDTEGADVISCSLGPNTGAWELTSTLALAIDEVTRLGRGGLGTPVFWAVSNGHFPIFQDEVVSHPPVIRVGRSNRNDLHDGSAFGPELDFLAPGAAVFSTRSGGDYGVVTGTSFAAPAAAGVGALILANNPHLMWHELRARMRDNCDKVGALPYQPDRNDEYGFGRINAHRSV